MALKSRHMNIVNKDLNLKIKVSTHGFEESTHKYSRQRFEFKNKGIDT